MLGVFVCCSSVCEFIQIFNGSFDELHFHNHKQHSIVRAKLKEREKKEREKKKTRERSLDYVNFMGGGTKSVFTY